MIYCLIFGIVVLCVKEPIVPFTMAYTFVK